MSLGEDRVRIKFNPSDNSLVSQIKQKSAELIDLCEKARNEGSTDREPQRLWASSCPDPLRRRCNVGSQSGNILMTARDIKDYSIALEALSRFPGTEDISGRIRDLLLNLIQEEETKAISRPAPKSKLNLDDEIPF